MALLYGLVFAVLRAVLHCRMGHVALPNVPFGGAVWRIMPAGMAHGVARPWLSGSCVLVVFFAFFSPMAGSCLAVNVSADMFRQSCMPGAAWRAVVGCMSVVVSFGCPGASAARCCGQPRLVASLWLRWYALFGVVQCLAQPGQVFLVRQSGVLRFHGFYECFGRRRRRQCLFHLAEIRNLELYRRFAACAPMAANEQRGARLQRLPGLGNLGVDGLGRRYLQM